MKLITLALILLTNFNTLALESFRATEIFSEVEVAHLVDSYYELHDSRAKASEYLKLLVEDDLYMLMGSVVTTKKQFKKWLKKSRILSKKVNHRVLSIDIEKSADGSYFVDTCVNYKGKLRLGFKFNKTSQITWKLVESKDESKLLIKDYIVKENCK